LNFFISNVKFCGIYYSREYKPFYLILYNQKNKEEYDLLKILLIILLVITIIIFFFIIGIKNKKQAVQTFTIPFFIHSYSNLTDKEQGDDDKSFIDKINDFFNEKVDSDLVDDGNGDGDHDDGGEA
jgi:hypothetical protein